MLLAIDAGNTETVLGLLDLAADPANAVVAHWRIATVSGRTSDEWGLMLSQMLARPPLDGMALEGVAISSTVPRVQGTLRRMAEEWLCVPVVVVGPGAKSGIPILYDDPREVGADRIANAVATKDLYGFPSIVVDFGTATTFDAISSSGEYLGGAIVPGVEVSLEALFERASLLRRIDLGKPRNVIGRSSAESIQSGVLYGFAAQADGICERFIEQLGEAEIVATGGLGTLIVPFCRRVNRYDPWLTLHGLRLIFERNHSQ